MAIVHPDMEPLAFLVGTWTGSGMGVYPTIEPFNYDEHIEITAPPKPFLAYTQRTSRAETGEPLHVESGYLRCPDDETAELVIAQPTGIAELHAGTIDGSSVHLRSTNVSRTATAKQVDTVERHIEVVDGVLRYELLMAAMGQSHQTHLRAELLRS